MTSAAVELITVDPGAALVQDYLGYEDNEYLHRVSSRCCSRRLIRHLLLMTLLTCICVVYTIGVVEVRKYEALKAMIQPAQVLLYDAPSNTTCWLHSPYFNVAAQHHLDTWYPMMLLGWMVLWFLFLWYCVCDPEFLGCMWTLYYRAENCRRIRASSQDDDHDHDHYHRLMDHQMNNLPRALLDQHRRRACEVRLTRGQIADIDRTREKCRGLYNGAMPLWRLLSLTLMFYLVFMSAFVLVAYSSADYFREWCPSRQPFVLGPQPYDTSRAYYEAGARGPRERDSPYYVPGRRLTAVPRFVCPDEDDQRLQTFNASTAAIRWSAGTLVVSDYPYSPGLSYSVCASIASVFLLAASLALLFASAVCCPCWFTASDT